MGAVDPAVAAVLQALTAPAAPEQVSESYQLPDGSTMRLPTTMTLTNAALARLVSLVTGEQFGYAGPEPDLPNIPRTLPTAPVPPPPPEVVEARKAEAAAVAEAWEGSPEQAALRAEREASRRERAARMLDQAVDLLEEGEVSHDVADELVDVLDDLSAEIVKW